MKTIEYGVKALGLKKFFFKEEQQNFIAVATPNIGTTNLGDEIISEAVIYQLQELFPQDFLISYPTHTMLGSQTLNSFNSARLRFIGGSNLMTGHIRLSYNQWCVPLEDFWKYRSSILFGVGWREYQGKPSLFSRIFYSALLSKELLHSVRDSYAEEKMKALGYSNVLNTCCPTTWGLTPDFCRNISTERRKYCIVALNGYARAESDRAMIDAVLQNYEKCFFFQQGPGDLKYLSELTNKLSSFIVLPPKLAVYNKILQEEKPDFIGTRLHGGIRALQYGCRALIVAIDNRSIDIARDINLPVIPMEDVSNGLPKILRDGWNIQIHIPEENIRQWKAQFQNQ